MDFAAAYCPTRRNIEEHGWALCERLFSLTTRLLKSIDQDHEAFVALRQECSVTKASLRESQASLRGHRFVHGC